MQAYFEERNYLHHPRIIRAPSNRPNIFYMVRETDPQEGSLLSQAAVQAKEAWMESGLFDHACDKIILYVRIYKDADDLASYSTAALTLRRVERRWRRSRYSIVGPRLAMPLTSRRPRLSPKASTILTSDLS